VPFDGAFSPLHWLIIAVVALLVLGPDKLPGAARKAGAAWRSVELTCRALLDDARGIVDAPVRVDAPPDDPAADTTPVAADPRAPARGAGEEVGR
jgi:TatA/E family protein of Tat protein translocase